MTVWLPIVDYSGRTGLSISTIRRRIRNSQLLCQKREGKYYIQYEGPQEGSIRDSTEADSEQTKGLLKLIDKLEEENAELRMLLDVLTRRTLL